MLRFLLTLFVSLILMFDLSGCSGNLSNLNNSYSIKPGEDINFFIASDLHHLSKSVYDDGEAFKKFFSTSDGKLIQYSTEILDCIKNDIELDKPDFLILPGDLTTSGDKKSHLELATLLKEIEQLGTTVLVVPGNHDIKNPWAREFQGSEVIKTPNISLKEWKQIYNPFGYEDALSKDKDSSSYLVAPSKDLWILMIDSTISNEKSKNLYPVKGGELSQKTIDWIKKCSKMANDNNAKLMAVMHHNLLDHSQIFKDNYTINNQKEVLDALLEANVKLALTGHIHIQDIKSYTENEKTIFDIGNSSVLVYPNQYGKLKFTPDIGYNYVTKKINLEIDPDNFDKETFENYTVCLFMEQCCSQYKECISELNELNDEDLEKAYAVIVEMNKMYFSGYRNEALSEITESEGFKILKDVSPCFATEYVDSMLLDQNSDNNVLFVPVD